MKLRKKTIANIVLLTALWGGVLSCGNEEFMPSLNKKNQTETQSEAINHPGNVVEISVDQKISFNFKQPALKSLSLDQSEVTSNGNTYSIPGIKWNKGDVFTVYYCFRNKVNADQKYVYEKEINDFLDKTKGSDVQLIVESVSADGKQGTARIKGNIKILEEYLTSDKQSFKEPDNWYFGAYLCGKQDSVTKTITDNLGTDRDYAPNSKTGKIDIVGIKFAAPTKLLAINKDTKTFDMNIPLCIPFQKVSLTNGSINMADIVTVKPVGTILNLALRNDFANAIAINKSKTDYMIRLKSKCFFRPNNKFNYDADLSKVGTDEYQSGYKDNNLTPEEIGADGWNQLAIDWSQYNGSNVKGDYVILNSKDVINLYVWTVCYDHSANPLEVDFSGLDLLIAAQEPKDGTPYECRADFVKPYTHGSLPLGKVRLFGGVNNTTGANRLISESDNIEYNYFSKKTEPVVLKESFSHNIPLSIHGDLMITEVYFSWKSGQKNKGLVELFNPNNSNIPLQDYYLARLRYNDRINPGSNSTYNGRIQFRSTWENDDERLQFALLMPLDLSDANKLGLTNTGKLIEITPAGFPEKTTRYYDYPNKIFSSDANKCYRATSALYTPNGGDNPLNKAFNYIPSGWTFCLGGAGVYELAGKRDDPRSNDELLGVNELGQAGLFSYANYENNKNPKQFTHVWGILDGIFEKIAEAPHIKYNDNASANEKEAGVMARDANQGWALVKKIEDKFYVLDTFGPSVASSDKDVMTPENFRDYMATLKASTSPTDNRNWSIRKQSAIFPNGGYFYGSEWSFSINVADSNIGIRARYCNGNTRPNTVPYFSGNAGNTDAKFLPNVYK